MSSFAPEIVPDPIDERIRSVFAAVLKIDGTSLGEHTHLTRDLSVDSLDALELALRIQDSFGIELDEGDFASFTSYGEVVGCVRKVMARELPQN